MRLLWQAEACPTSLDITAEQAKGLAKGLLYIARKLLICDVEQALPPAYGLLRQRARKHRDG